VSEAVVGACIEVHRHLGPGLLESGYEEELAHELGTRGLPFLRQVSIDARYKNHPLGVSYRADFIVERLVVVELKAVELVLPVHSAQVLTYLRVSGLPVGLLINFNAPLLRNGIRRLTNNAPKLSPQPTDYLESFERKRAMVSGSAR
jgi:GxxExxY protein